MRDERVGVIGGCVRTQAGDDLSIAAQRAWGELIDKLAELTDPAWLDALASSGGAATCRITPEARSCQHAGAAIDRIDGATLLGPQRRAGLASTGGGDSPQPSIRRQS
jgi:hypothetical protein